MYIYILYLLYLEKITSYITYVFTNPVHKQDVTQGQFFNRFEFKVFFF